MKERDLKKRSLLAEIACDYYERHLSQNEIADRLCLSRTRVSRLLKEAEDEGIVKVQVTINYEYERHYEIEERLKSRYPIKNVRVLNNRNRDPQFIQQDVGKLAADYILKNLKKDYVIGMSWGTTLSDTVSNLKKPDFPVHVVQLMGAVLCQHPQNTPQGIVTNAAKCFNGNGHYLNMPLYIENPAVRQALCEEPNNKTVLNMGTFSDMIVTSVNDLEHIKDKEFWHTYLTKEMFSEIKQKGGVGAMFGRFFDKNGQEIDCSWNERCVSISFKNIKSSPNVIAVVSGEEKVSPISCAIKGGLIDTLITDGTTASRILGLK